MQAILKFNLDDCEDKQAHYLCIKAHDMALLLSDLADLMKRLYEEVDETEPKVDKAGKLTCRGIYEALGAMEMKRLGPGGSIELF